MSPAGIDLRDLYRPGGGSSRLTLRRLRVLVRGLPPDSWTWLSVREDNEQAKADATVTRLHDRAEHYRRKAG